MDWRKLSQNLLFAVHMLRFVIHRFCHDLLSRVFVMVARSARMRARSASL